MSNAAENDIVDSKLIFKLSNIKKPILKDGTEKRRALTSEENDAAHWVGHHNAEGLFLLVVYHLGLRCGEALGLKWGDFDLDAGVLHIRRDLDFYARKHDGCLDKDKAKAAALKTEKLQRIGRVISYAGRRTIPIFDAEFLRTLKDRKGADDQFVFVGPLSGEPLSDASFKRIWTRLMKAMVEHTPGIEGVWGTKTIKTVEDGKPATKEEKVKIRSILTPHYFRHNFATALY